MKKVLLSLLILTSFLFASQGDHKSELSVTVGGVKPEGNLDLKNELNLGLRYGVYVQDMFFDVVEGGFERESGVKYDNVSNKTDINRFFVNLVKEYDLSKDTALYGLVGVGYEDYRNPMFGNEDDGFLQYGVGVKQWITEQFALKAEVRHGITFGGDNNLFYNVGFVIPFGKKETTKMPIKSEPIVMKKKPEPKKMVKKEEPKPEPVVIVTPKDDDNDGVINTKDHCLNTPAGKLVETNGCMKVITLHINFDNDKYDVPSKYTEIFNQVTDVVKEDNNYKISLAGHTDSRGSVAYNQKLSEKRADAVKKALVKLGVDSNIITTKGYGESKPVASNNTDEGRAENRRVEVSFDK